MPAKSRRKRGKHIPPSRRIKHSGISSSTTAVKQTTVNDVDSIVAVGTSITSAKKSSSQLQTTVARYPYISSELITIGIFATLVLVILGILAAVL